MTSSFAVLLICVLAHSVSSTRFTEQLNNQPTNRQLFPAFEIVGSNQTNISMFPYTVSISYNGSLLGSGAILNKHWILCSASQLESYEKDVLTVRAGSDYYSTGGQAVHTGKIFVNEHYTGDFPYNVAIIKLNGSINFSAKAKPVRIAASPPKAGCKASVTGWGKQSPTKDSGNRLQVAHITVKPVAECQASHPTIDVGKVICADADGVGHCNGDKGDPLLRRRKLIGHFIGGNECNLLQDYELYSNLSIYRRWIIRTVRKNSIGYEAEGIDKL